MTMFASVQNGSLLDWPLAFEQIQQQHPNVSFPANPQPEDLADFDYVPIQYAPQPVVDPVLEYCREGAATLIDGVCVVSWDVVQYTAEEKAEGDSRFAAVVRADRNKRLADCDWTQLPDAPVDRQVWVAYRQALRDVTKQPGFPRNVTWPQSPS